MPLVQDNSYLINFDDPEVIGYIIDKNETIYVDKQDITVYKDPQIMKVFVYFSKYKDKAMCFRNHGFEKVYYKNQPNKMFEFECIIPIKSSEIKNLNDAMRYWIDVDYDEAVRLSDKDKEKYKSKHKD